MGKPANRNNLRTKRKIKVTKQRKTRRTHMTRKQTTRKRRGGDDRQSKGDKLMEMVRENAMTVEKKKPHTHDAIIRQFNRVKEDDLYNSILRFQKKYPQTQELKDKMWSELYPYQDEHILDIHSIPECVYNKMGDCRRKNPVHRYADERRIKNPAYLIAGYLKGI